MSDILQRILISVQSTADAVFANLSSVATVSFTDIEDATASLDSALSMLDSSLAGTAAGMDGLAGSTDAFLAAAAQEEAEFAALIDATSTLDASLGGLDASAAAAATSIDDITISTVPATGSLAGLDTALGTVDASLAGVDASAGTAAVSVAAVGAASNSTGMGMKTILGTLLSTSKSFNMLKQGAGNLVFGLRNLGTEGTIGMDALKQGAGQAALGLAGLAVQLTLIGAVAAVAFGVISVKAASDFQSSMLKVQAYVGMTKSQIDSMSQSILQDAPQWGVAPKALADSLYFVSSAGFKGADALTVLKYSAMTAAAANVDASTTGFALVSSLNALGLKSSQSGNIMDELNATVKNGVMTWDQYGSVVGKIAGSVSAAGGNAQMLQHNFTDLNAALDVYTNSGISARQASMWLSADMSLLYGKAGTLATNAQKLGLSFDASKYASMDFAQKLAYLNQITNGNHQELVKLLGGNSQVANSVAFLNNHYGTLNSTISSITGTMKNGASTQQMFNIAQQGLNFQLAKAGAAFQSLQIVVGSAFLPVVTGLLSKVSTGIGAFAAWLASGNRLQNAMSAVGTVLSGIGTVIGGVVSAGAGIITFFRQNQVAALALLIPLGMLSAVLVSMAVSAFVAFLASVPALITGFIAWATAAGAAAIATLAATWPILAIGAAIGLVVAGIILAIQHWGAIVSWLKGVWSAFSSWFGSVMSAVGTFFHTVWTGIQQFFVAVWNAIVSVARVVGMVLLAVIIGPIGLAVLYIITHWTQVKQFLSNLWNGIVSLAKSIWNNITSAISTAIQTVVGWFSWLYNHNYYFKDLVDFIRNLFTALGSWLHTTWHTIVSWVTNTWQTLVSDAQTLWNDLTTAIRTAVQTEWQGIQNIWNTITSWLGSVWHALSSLATGIWNTITATISNFLQMEWTGIQNIWNTVVSFLRGIWNTIVADVSTMWSKISSFFVNAWSTYISGPLSSLWNNFSSWFGNLASQALSWGANLLQGFINGILSMLGNLKNAVGNVLSTIAGLLGFHSPTKEGEGRFIIQWGQNMVKGFSQGVVDAIPTLQAAVNLAMQPVAQTMGAPASAGPAQIASSGGGTHHYHNTITVQVNGQRSKSEAQEIADVVEARMTKKFKGNNGNAWHGGSW